MNCIVPVVRATLSTPTSVLIMYTDSTVKCTGSGYTNSDFDNEASNDDENISPAPTYSWHVSTIIAVLHFGPNSSGYLTITRDLIGRTTFTCIASNTIRGVTYWATSDPFTVFIMNKRDDAYSPGSDRYSVVTMNIRDVTYSPGSDRFIIGKYPMARLKLVS